MDLNTYRNLLENVIKIRHLADWMIFKQSKDVVICRKFKGAVVITYIAIHQNCPSHL